MMIKRRAQALKDSEQDNGRGEINRDRRYASFEANEE